MTPLERAAFYAVAWQRAHSDRTGRCLECVRYACGKAGLKLPPPMAKPMNTALANFHAMSANPAKYGWRQVHHNAAGGFDAPFVLCYFKGCYLTDGREAGHVAVFSTKDNEHHANESWPMTAGWASRLCGAFVPK